MDRYCRVCASLLVTLLFLVIGAQAVEHPGVLTAEDDCLKCHAQKVRGKSVHSAMSTSCGVCHVMQTRGDMTTMALSMPKEKICSACHQDSPALRQHVPNVKGTCVDCHDAHSSDRRMLLREVSVLQSSNKK